MIELPELKKENSISQDKMNKMFSKLNIGRSPSIKKHEFSP